MVSKSLISVLALTSVVSASAALRRTTTEDPCKVSDMACRNLGIPEIGCDCRNLYCVGQDNSRSEGYCPYVPSPSGGKPIKLDGKFWNIKRVTRFCGKDKGVNDNGDGKGNNGDGKDSNGNVDKTREECDFDLDLEANGGTQHCTVIRRTPVDAPKESWANVACGDFFTLSWRVIEDPAPASALVSVVSKTGEVAYFPIPNVNGADLQTPHTYGDFTGQVYLWK